MQESKYGHTTLRPKKRIAVCTMGVKLPGEMRGYTRFRKIAEMLARAGFAIDLITSSFQHWEKAPRDKGAKQYTGLPYNIVFIDEPGYKKNLDVRRIASHRRAARNFASYFATEGRKQNYSLIYAEIPPNDVALACAKAAKNADIPFVADINDLWPEAMRMVFDVPLLSKIAFFPFERDAAKVYTLLDAAVGTSDEYALRPACDRQAPYLHHTVYVGNDLAAFDVGVQALSDTVKKPAGEFWLAYAGTLGASYDIKTLLEASAEVALHVDGFRVKIMGDGPERVSLEEVARTLGAPADFLGYVEYAQMAAYLAASDLTINSLVAAAPQSIVTKIGDYLAAGIPLINTGSSPEFRAKVSSDGFGVNVESENTHALAQAIIALAQNSSERKIMGVRARQVAEIEFDQERSYQEIVHLVQELVL